LVTFYVLADTVHATGWRLELADPASDDSSPRRHGVPHVQRISSWSKTDDEGFFLNREAPLRLGDRERALHVNETRPAFPLPVESAAGLLVAAMGSLYGGPSTRAMLEGLAMSQLQGELDGILGA
jgi:hypothetical protein